MFSVGPTELLVIFLILLIAVILPIWLCLFLRKKYPQKTWLGLLLSFIFPFIGQIYVKKPMIFIFILMGCALLLWKILGDTAISWTLVNILSMGVMYFRLKNYSNNAFNTHASQQ